jgi:hypothetical protein
LAISAEQHSDRFAVWKDMAYQWSITIPFNEIDSIFDSTYRDYYSIQPRTFDSTLVLFKPNTAQM